jgi:hypothetical protein
MPDSVRNVHSQVILDTHLSSPVGFFAALDEQTMNPPSVAPEDVAKLLAWVTPIEVDYILFRVFSNPLFEAFSVPLKSASKS